MITKYINKIKEALTKIKKVLTKIKEALTKEYVRSEDDKNRDKKSLRFLGILAIILGFSVYVVGKYAYDIPFGKFTSISASANFLGTAYLLPFVMGAMAVFFYQYKGYNLIDTILGKILMVAAIFVALFQCNGHPIKEKLCDKISILGLLPDVSNKIHTIFAIILFITLIFWISNQFTKPYDLATLIKTVWKKLKKSPPSDNTDISIGKKWRNLLYYTLSIIAVGALVCVFNPALKSVWFAEVLILIPCGIALLIKSGKYKN